MNSFPWIAALLFALNVLLAAGRAAMVNARRAVLEEWREAGRRGAGLALRLANESTRLIAASRGAQTVCRVAVTLAAAQVLRAAWLSGEPAWWYWLAAVLLLGALIALGEVMAEALALRAAERASVIFAPLMALTEVIFWPLSWSLLRVGGGRIGPRGVPAVVTEEEIKTLVDAGEEGGAIEEEEKEMIYSIFKLGDTLVREIMVPRIDLTAVEVHTPLTAAIDIAIRHGHSRLPIYEHSVDNVIGLVHVKDLLRATREGRPAAVRDLLRPVHFVPEAKKADELLAELQSQHTHMAVVVDEYGGTAGVVTIEDLLEEIVGEIRDEYDGAEEAPVVRVGEDEYLLDAGLNINEVNGQLGVRLSDEFGDTLGGLLYAHLGKVPERGEAVWAEGFRWIVEQVAGRRIRRVRAVRLPSGPVPESEVKGDA
jgi:magnesium and cobalt exporter, CNNM family